MERIERLGPAQCLSLLGSGTLGHVSITHDGLPVILPVAFRLSGGTVYINTHDSALVRAARAGGAVVAFEVDHLEPEAASGWSVLVRGVMRVARLGTPRERAPRLSGTKDNTGDSVLSITPILLTGRRLGGEVQEQKGPAQTLPTPGAHPATSA